MEKNKLIEKSKKIYFIPNIKLIGYGRSQIYQIECLRCKTLFFEQLPDIRLRKIEHLFCDSCNEKLLEIEKEKYLKEENISNYAYIGNLKGWIIKLDVSYRRRSFYNYNKVYKRDKYICQYCGYSPLYCKEFRQLYIDHVLPWSVRGSNSLDNLRVACATCNLIAGDKWFVDFFEKKQYVLDELKKRGIKTYLDLKVKFENK
jgi:phage FluMu protein Com